MASKKVQKQVQVIARFAHKCNGVETGLVSFKVRSSNGKNQYCTTLLNGKAIGCNCKSRKPCYHMTQLEVIEGERRAEAAHEAFIAAANIVAQPVPCKGVEAVIEEAPANTPLITLAQIEVLRQDHELGLLAGTPDHMFSPEALAAGWRTPARPIINTSKALPKAPVMTPDIALMGSLNGNRTFIYSSR